MNKITRVLIPFNLTQSAENALDYALALAEETRMTHILLMYVIESEDERKKVEERLTIISKNAVDRHPNVDLSFTIAPGAFVETIMKAYKEFKAEIIIMGTKGLDGNPDLRSTNTSRLVQSVDCPVIAVPASATSFNLKHITLAIDKDEIEKPDILKVLLIIARRFNAKIHVLTVYDENDADYLKDRDNEATLKYYFERYYETSAVARSSNIAESIIEYNRKHNIDMMAIIPRTHSSSETKSEGKLTQYLTLHTEIPILIID